LATAVICFDSETTICSELFTPELPLVTETAIVVGVATEEELGVATFTGVVI
jgi:hypothetical protein